MSDQKKAFELCSPLGFGKYAKLSVHQIYCGAESLPKIWCRQSLKNLFSNSKPWFELYNKKYAGIVQVEFIGSYMVLEIQDGYEYISGLQGLSFGVFDYFKDINRFLAECYYGTPQDDEQNSVAMYSEGHFEGLSREEMTDFNEIIGKEYYDLEDRYALKYGKPSYISWLIKNVEFFSLSPSDLICLENLEINSFVGFQVKKINEKIFSPYTMIAQRRESFSEAIKLLNEKKWQKFQALEDRRKNTYQDDDSGLQESTYNYSDGYGGRVSDRFIDDALDGEPDAYWNLD